jgi:predicted phage terminase large subunit-like protein
MSTTFPLSTAEYQALLREDLTGFIERAFYELNSQSVFLPGQYIELLAATLDRCRTGETKRLIINLPPRTLKSHAASVAFPAWLLGQDPTIQIICASYGQDLADKHARDCRTLMNSDFYKRLFPAAALSEAKLAVNDFMTSDQGFRMSTSVGGVLTGRGADVIILDDILKPEDALSETRRKAANEWYFSTLLSRLNSKKHGVIIIVMQRLHQEDLVGEVTDREPWEVLSLPAIAIDDEEYRYANLFGEKSFARNAGEALHPERDSVETYEKIREAVGEYNFQSQYQQSPMSREGGLIKKSWLKFYEPGRFPSDVLEWTIQSWDTACKIGDANDFSVCTTWKLIGRDYYLVDVFRERLTYPELKRRAVELFNKFRPFKVVIEDQASGTALIQEIASEGVYCAEAYKRAPGSDKLVRFAAHSIKFENGRVFLPNQTPWLDEYIREITGFPGSKHDDQVDSTSQALESLEPCAKSVAVFKGLEYLSNLHYPTEYGGSDWPRLFRY